MSEAIGVASIDETIQQVEMLYRSVTGRDAPPAEATYAPIPAEKDPTRHVEEQMDRLLALLGQAQTRAGVAPSWTPPMLVTESDAELVIYLDLPGVGRDRVEVKQQGELLTVSGERPLPGNGGGRLRMSERPLGPFRRTLWIPTRPTELTAQMKDGVLEIRVRKEVKAEPQAKTVLVN
jgi:HSP20 family protein